MKFKKSSSLVSCLVIALFLGVWFKKKPHEILVSYDAALSPAAISLLHKYIKSYSENLFENLHANYSFVQSCMVKNSDKQLYSIKVHKPLCKVNNDLLLFNGALIPAHLYDESFWQSLYIIKANTIIESQKKDIAAWVQKIPANVLDEYEIFWQDKTAIFLTSRTDANHSFCISHEIRYDPLLFERASTACHIIMHEQKTKSIIPLIVDIRFKGQIIVYKRGEWNEKGVIS